MSSSQLLLDAAGRRRSPVTTPGARAGIAPRNKGERYRGDPPAVDEIVAVMRQVGHARHGDRLNALIVVLWRAGLRIQEVLSLTETDLDQRRGSILVRHGKNHRRREVGMDGWGWSALEPWLADRVDLPVGPLFCVIDGPTRGRAWSVSAARIELHRPAPRSGRAATVRAAPVAPCARCRVAARRDLAAADPAPARALASLNDRNLPPGDRHRGDHLDRPRAPRADDARQRRACPVAEPAGAHHALPHPSAPMLARQAAIRHQRRWSIDATLKPWRLTSTSPARMCA